MEKKPYPQVGQIWHSKWFDALLIIIEVLDKQEEVPYAKIRWTDTMERDEVTIGTLLQEEDLFKEFFTFIG